MGIRPTRPGKSEDRPAFCEVRDRSSGETLVSLIAYNGAGKHCGTYGNGAVQTNLIITDAAQRPRRLSQWTGDWYARKWFKKKYQQVGRIVALIQVTEAESADKRR